MRKMRVGGIACRLHAVSQEGLQPLLQRAIDERASVRLRDALEHVDIGVNQTGQGRLFPVPSIVTVACAGGVASMLRILPSATVMVARSMTRAPVNTRTCAITSWAGC